MLMMLCRLAQSTNVARVTVLILVLVLLQVLVRALLPAHFPNPVMVPPLCRLAHAQSTNVTRVTVLILVLVFLILVLVLTVVVASEMPLPPPPFTPPPPSPPPPPHPQSQHFGLRRTPPLTHCPTTCEGVGSSVDGGVWCSISLMQLCTLSSASIAGAYIRRPTRRLPGPWPTPPAGGSLPSWGTACLTGATQ
jgi:hypothetical protein